MSLNLLGTDSTSLAALAIVKGCKTSLDLTSITQGRKRMLSFLSQAVGIVAEVDLGTDNLRWMGSARFTFGFFARIMRKTVYPCELAIKVDVEKEDIKSHFRRRITRPSSVVDLEYAKTQSLPGLPSLTHGTVQSALPPSFAPVSADKIGNFYAGNMSLMAPGANFFPASLPADGHLDLIIIEGDIGRLAAIQCFLGVESGSFFDNPCVNYRKIGGYRIKPLSPGDGYIAIDGERIPFEEFQAEVHRGLGSTLSKKGVGYETEELRPQSLWK